MSRIQRKWAPAAGSLLLLSLWTLFGACSSDDNNPTPTPMIVAAGGTTAGPVGTGTSGSPATEPDITTGAAGAAGAPDNGAAGAAAAGAPAACAVNAADRNCYQCPSGPRSSVEFLNQCPTTGCVPFDNSTLTTLLPDGSLQPLS